MTHLADAVGQLIRQHRMRIHYLPGDAARSYTVRAPALLTQLADLTASSSGGRGGRTIPGSRLPIAVDAWQLWCDITTTVHAWARFLEVNRRPFLELDRAARAAAERVPDWHRTLRPWLGPVAWDAPLDIPVAGPAVGLVDQADVALAALPLEANFRGHIDPQLPPLGRLLRATAAAAARAGHELTAGTITRKASCGRDIAPVDCDRGCWEHRIRGILAATVDDREVRGAACWECQTIGPNGELVPTRTALVERDGERYRAPAIVIRVAVLPGAGPDDQPSTDDDLWVYRMCRACGAEGWLDYSTDTDGGPSPVLDLDPAAARRAELRAAAVAQRREAEDRWGPPAAPEVLAGVTTKDHEAKLTKGAA